jgi:hypothetical protein
MKFRKIFTAYSENHKISIKWAKFRVLKPKAAIPIFVV